MTTLSEKAVKAAMAVLYYANPNDVERAITAAIPFLPVQGAAAARDLALGEAAKIAFDISENGEYHGEASVDTTSSIYQQGAFEVYEAIRSLSPPDHADAGKVEGDGWRPIETAPKDGTPVLAYQAGRYFKCWMECDQYEGGYFWQDEEDSEPSPTHWRPLPSAPASEGAE